METKTTLFSLLIIFMALTACEEGNPGEVPAAFCSVAPEGWECEVFHPPFDSSMIPRNADLPEVIVRYHNPGRTFPRYPGEELYASLILDLYPVEQKEACQALVASQQMYSWCIPVYYGEHRDYYILTSPCFINGGTFTERADSALADLHAALGEILEDQNPSWAVRETN